LQQGILQGGWQRTKPAAGQQGGAVMMDGTGDVRRHAGFSGTSRHVIGLNCQLGDKVYGATSLVCGSSAISYCGWRTTMKSLTDHLAQYAAYHRDRRNIATHF